MATNSRRRIIAGVAALAAIQVVAVGVYLGVERARRPEADEPFRVERLSGRVLAPNIVLEREDGTRISIREVAGKVRLVHFWATWCPPCVEELPGLLSTARDLANRGVTLVAISMDAGWPAIRSFFDGEIPPEIYRAVDPDAHSQFDIVSLPDTYLVGSDGRLKLRYGGARHWSARAAKLHLEAQLP